MKYSRIEANPAMVKKTVPAFVECPNGRMAAMNIETTTIAILDDEPDRVDAMLRSLSANCPEYETAVFDNAPDMIEWLAEHHDKACLICLDHDLGPNRQREEKSFDPGTGRDVVDFLAGLPPTCRVVVHTTNQLAAPGMLQALEDRGWSVSRVSPYSDLDWIEEDWIEEVERSLPRR